MKFEFTRISWKSYLKSAGPSGASAVAEGGLVGFSRMMMLKNENMTNEEAQWIMIKRYVSALESVLSSLKLRKVFTYAIRIPKIGEIVRIAVAVAL